MQGWQGPVLGGGQYRDFRRAAAGGSFLSAGAAAAIATAGAHPDVRSAAAAMGKVHRSVYQPDVDRAAAYDALFAEYSTLHDYFGRGGNDVMRRLRASRRESVTR